MWAIAGIKSVLVFDQHIVSESGIILDGHDLSVSRRENRISRAIRRKIDALVNVPLTRKGMPVLAKGHRNVPNTALDGPQTRDVREKGILGIEELAHFLDRLHRILQETGKALKLGDFLDGAGRRLLDVEKGRKVAVLHAALRHRCVGIKADDRKGSGKRGLEVLRGAQKVPRFVLEAVEACTRFAGFFFKRGDVLCGNK